MIGDELAEDVLNGHLEFMRAVSMFRADVISAVLKYHNGNISASARSLGIRRTALLETIRKYKEYQVVVSKARKQRPKVAKTMEKTCDICRCPVVENRPCQGCLALQTALESIRAAHTCEFCTAQP